MNGLYAIIDTETLLRAGLNILRFADAVLKAQPGALQLRDKRLDSRDHLRLLRALVPRCAAAAVPLFGNDRVDLALLAGCSGVHVGQQDLPPTAVRELAVATGRNDFLVGMSVHNDEELAIARREGPDYIALGPVFETRSKTDPDPALGWDEFARLARSARRAGPQPRVAIGGIDLARAAKLPAHCEMAAVIGALVDDAASDPYAAATLRAQALQRCLLRGDAG